MELSQRDEKARLDRLRQEEEELEKVRESKTQLCLNTLFLLAIPVE